MNMYHMDNNLMGFQMGMLHDTIRLTDRFAIEGFLNAGVFYNQVKYSNVMGVFTTQTFADNTRVGSGSTRRRLEYREQRRSRYFRNLLHDRSVASRPCAGSTSVGRCVAVTNSCGWITSTLPSKRFWEIRTRTAI